jgi:hypothetical protein
MYVIGSATRREKFCIECADDSTDVCPKFFFDLSQNEIKPVLCSENDMKTSAK